MFIMYVSKCVPSMAGVCTDGNINLFISILEILHKNTDKELDKQTYHTNICEYIKFNVFLAMSNSGRLALLQQCCTINL